MQRETEKGARYIDDNRSPRFRLWLSKTGGYIYGYYLYKEGHQLKCKIRGSSSQRLRRVKTPCTLYCKLYYVDNTRVQVPHENRKETALNL